MKAVFAVALSFLLVFGGQATPVTWTLLPLHFSGPTNRPGSSPGTVSGTFTYDADTNTYSNWNFVFSGFSAYQTFTLTPATSSVQVWLPTLRAFIRARAMVHQLPVACSFLQISVVRIMQC
jgi:hypothetical protein